MTANHKLCTEGHGFDTRRGVRFLLAVPCLWHAGGGEQGDEIPRVMGAGSLREAGEGSAGDRTPKRAGAGRNTK